MQFKKWSTNYAIVREWKPPNGKTISKSTASNSQIMVASGCELYYLEIGEGELKQVR